MKLSNYFLIACTTLITITSCTKSTPAAKPTTYPINGLWIGTYSYQTQPPLFFSFSIYPDGSLSYKSSGTNGYTFYAIGTWNLADTIFTYHVVTTNNPGGTQSTQNGTAIFKSTGTLIGTNTDSATSASGTFTMQRDN